MKSSREDRLLERARAFDDRAFAQLYRAHVDPIYRYVYLRLNDARAAEQLTSEVFLRAVEGLPAFQGHGVAFSAWLFQIADERVTDYYRRQVREANGVHRQDGLPGEVAMRSDDEIVLHAGLEQLTEEQRRILALRFIEDEPLAEVARRLDETEEAVKALQHRALAALGRTWEGKKA